MRLIDSIKAEIDFLKCVSLDFKWFRIVKILMTQRTLDLLISEIPTNADYTGITKQFVFDIEIQIDDSLFGTGRDEDHDFALVIR